MNGFLVEDPLFYRKIVFSHEVFLLLNGYVNKQNCQFWREDQPEELQKLPMHPENVKVGAVYGLVASLERTSSKIL